MVEIKWWTLNGGPRSAFFGFLSVTTPEQWSLDKRDIARLLGLGLSYLPIFNRILIAILQFIVHI